ncbi:MAG: hypothetical protein V4732_02400 [Pseudomonadota bacterium]
MNTKKYRLLLWILLSPMLAAHSYADNFFGSASVASEESNNARKTTTDQINERQDQYNLRLGGEVINSLLDFNAEYLATARNYAKDTQENNNLLEGRSTLLIGKNTQPADLLIEHSRVTVLKKPDATNLVENQDEREITSATPTLRGRLSPVDYIYLQGQLTKVNYAENGNKNSRREGGVLGLEHKISVTDKIKLFAQQTDIQFDGSPLENYVYRSAQIEYSTQLRQLSYSVQAGMNQSIPENDEKVLRPKYAFELIFNSGTQTFSLSLLQELTDASLGGGNKVVGGQSPSENDSAHNLDRFERKHVTASWSTQALCDSCSLVIGAYHIRDHYLPLEQLSTQRGWSFGLNYSLSHRSLITTSLLKGESEFTDSTFGEDFKSQTVRVAFVHKLNNDFSVGFHVNHEKRDSGLDGETYSERFIGASINYEF